MKKECEDCRKEYLRLKKYNPSGCLICNCRKCSTNNDESACMECMERAGLPVVK